MLKARDRRLRRQAAAVDRVAAQQQFVDRIVGEPVAIIAVRMATRNRKHTLRHQVADAVRHACRHAGIGDRRSQGRQQTLGKKKVTGVNCAATLRFRYSQKRFPQLCRDLLPDFIKHDLSLGSALLLMRIQGLGQPLHSALGFS